MKLGGPGRSPKWGPLGHSWRGSPKDQRLPQSEGGEELPSQGLSRFKQPDSREKRYNGGRSRACPETSLWEVPVRPGLGVVIAQSSHLVFSHDSPQRGPLEMFGGSDCRAGAVRASPPCGQRSWACCETPWNMKTWYWDLEPP